MYENSQQNKSSAFLYLKNEQSENYWNSSYNGIKKNKILRN